MKNSGIMISGALLACSLGSMAQVGNRPSLTDKVAQGGLAKGDSLRGDSIWKDVELGAVSVVASKPLVKMETGKMTYNVGEDPDAKASTVLDMLRKVPMVTVDGQDNITVNGSKSFKVYVDGKPNAMISASPSQVFKAMPATMVKSIEVVTNPGARYDAEGTGGVLNIVFNNSSAGGSGSEAINGYNGNVSVSVGNQTDKVSASVNGQQGKLTYSVMGVYNYQRMNGTTIDVDRLQKDMTAMGGDAGNSQMRYHQKSDMKQPFAMGSLSLGYAIDSLSNINATAGLTAFKQKMVGNPVTQMQGGVYGKGFSYGNEMRQDYGNSTFNGSVDYQRFWHGDHKSYMILSYLFTSNPSHTDQYTYYDDTSNVTGLKLNDLSSKNHTRGTEHTLQADFTQALSGSHTLNFGAKYILRANNADAKYYDVAKDRTETLDPAKSMEYKNTQDILAAYAEWKGKFGKWSTVLGSRYEYTWEKVRYELGNGDDFKKSYGNLVPSASVSYAISPGMNIGVNYSMRITRPGISYLNPYVDRSNPTALSYGNTDLETEKSHKVSLVYNFYSAKFMLSANAGYSFCDNQIEQYSFIGKDNLLNQTYGNVSKKGDASLNIFANWMIAKKTRLMFNGELHYLDLRSDALDMKNNGWNATSVVDFQQTLPWELQWSLGGVFSTKTQDLQGDKSGMTLAYTTLSKSLLKDRLDLSLSFVTPLTDKLNVKTRTANSDYVQNLTAKIPLRLVVVTATWKFGNTKKQFAKAKSNITNDFKEDQKGFQAGGITGQQ